MEAMGGDSHISAFDFEVTMIRQYHIIAQMQGRIWTICLIDQKCYE